MKDSVTVRESQKKNFHLLVHSPIDSQLALMLSLWGSKLWFRSPGACCSWERCGWNSWLLASVPIEGLLVEIWEWTSKEEFFIFISLLNYIFKEQTYILLLSNSSILGIACNAPYVIYILNFYQFKFEFYYLKSEMLKLFTVKAATFVKQNNTI